MSFKSLFLRQVTRYNKYAAFVPIVRSSSYKHNKVPDDGNLLKTASAAVIGSVLIGSALKEYLEITNPSRNSNVATKNISSRFTVHAAEDTFEAGVRRPELPTFRADEVMKHDTTDSFWVIYKNGVYDVTKFLVSHPGGEQILNAAGLSIEPFWNVYGMHKTPEVYKLLESFRIGNIHEDDVGDYSADELWAREPHRDHRLLIKTSKPFNAEIPPQLQIQNFDTPNELFYVRQHMPVPDIDPKEHTLTVTLIDDNGKCKQARFRLDELEKFPQNTVRAALMCAGNRRTEMNKVKPVKGLDWHGGAISSAVWEGVYLIHVLKQLGIDEMDTEGKHVIFTGSDIDATGVNFSTSIPLHQALSPQSRVLLATHMNGARLPPDHGYPLRVIVPGAPAVRSVKWLESITISSEESPSHWHQKDYRSFNPSTTWETADFPSAPPVYSLPVTSAVCHPGHGDTFTVTDGLVTVKGYAYSGGGAKIMRVDISTDQGRTWIPAPELKQDKAPPGQHYAWTLWSIDLPVEKGVKEMEIWAKATDSNFNTQPEKFDDIWNIRGILSNAYSKVKINIKHL